MLTSFPNRYLLLGCRADSHWLSCPCLSREDPKHRGRPHHMYQDTVLSAPRAVCELLTKNVEITRKSYGGEEKPHRSGWCSAWYPSPPGVASRPQPVTSGRHRRGLGIPGADGRTRDLQACCIASR